MQLIESQAQYNAVNNPLFAFFISLQCSCNFHELGPESDCSIGHLIRLRQIRFKTGKVCVHFGKGVEIEISRWPGRPVFGALALEALS